jgi:hypothetical protein
MSSVKVGEGIVTSGLKHRKYVHLRDKLLRTKRTLPKHQPRGGYDKVAPRYCSEQILLIRIFNLEYSSCTIDVSPKCSGQTPGWRRVDRILMRLEEVMGHKVGVVPLRSGFGGFGGDRLSKSVAEEISLSLAVTKDSKKVAAISEGDGMVFVYLRQEMTPRNWKRAMCSVI